MVTEVLDDEASIKLNNILFFKAENYIFYKFVYPKCTTLVCMELILYVVLC